MAALNVQLTWKGAHDIMPSGAQKLTNCPGIAAPKRLRKSNFISFVLWKTAYCSVSAVLVIGGITILAYVGGSQNYDYQLSWCAIVCLYSCVGCLIVWVACRMQSRLLSLQSQNHFFSMRLKIRGTPSLLPLMFTSNGTIITSELLGLITVLILSPVAKAPSGAGKKSLM